MKQRLKFGEQNWNPNVRMLHEMNDVIFDREWVKSADNLELYYMYRELYKQQSDLNTTRENHLRYDITIIPPNMLGREYTKTAGHYHPIVERMDLSYPEVYQVLEGEAIYLLQRMEEERVMDVIIIKAKTGEIAIIPPSYGHVTINRSDQTLKMANWVCDSFSSCYGPVKKYSGAAYYLLEDGLVRNENHTDVPDVRYIQPVDVPEFGLINGKDMYGLVDDIEKLRFLSQPHDFVHVFESIFKK